MKKFLVTFVLAVIAAVFAAVPTYASGIAVNVNGQSVIFEGQSPVIVDGRTLVPVRGVFELLGFEVAWNGDTRQATLSSANYTVVLTIASATFTVNGVPHTLEVPAQIIGGSTMLPLRAVLEPVGYDLNWQAETQLISVVANVPQMATTPPVPSTQELPWWETGTSEEVQQTVEIPEPQPTSQPIATIEPQITPQPEQPQPTPTTETAEQANARLSAQRYLDVSSFSRQGLIDQLIFVDFTRICSH